MMDDEGKTNERISNGSLVGFFQLQREIHDALRIQHPEWVGLDGDCPTCESYESRLAELLGLSTPTDVH